MADYNQGYGQSSLIPALNRGRRAGVALSGDVETIRSLMAWGELLPQVVEFTSRKVAISVIRFSQRIVPFDTSTLQQSAFVGSVAEVSDRLGIAIGGGGKAGEQIGASSETTIAFDALVPTISEIFHVPGNVGGTQRVYTKYACGYTADYAAKVHENLEGWEFHPSSKSGVSNPFGDGGKKSHFLLDAYNAHRGLYSKAMMAGIERLNTEFARKQAASGRVRYQPPGLGGPTGKPRIRKPGAP